MATWGIDLGTWRARWLALPAGIVIVAAGLLLPWADRFPRAWQLPLAKCVTVWNKALAAEIGGSTRFFAHFIEVPISAAIALFAKGADLRLAQSVLHLPPLSWVGLVGSAIWLARRTGGWRLATIQAVGCAYLLVFGQWTAAMLTLASVVISVPFALGLGVLLGLAAYRVPKVNKWLVTPALDLMQTVPAFAYLIPMLILFGFGPVSAMLATVIFALPPMARVTTLALSQLSPEIVELAAVIGCTRAQAMWRVLVPSAMPMLLIGFKQTVMMTLNMVIIASMIGAGGLGFDVLLALRQLDIGRGFEAGSAIVVLAIMLDRQGRALASGWSKGEERRGGGYRLGLGGAAWLLLTTVLGLWVAAVGKFPHAFQITTGNLLNDAVTWINVNFFDTIEAGRVFVLLHLMNPIRIFLTSAPWLAVAGLVALASALLGGWRLGLLAVLVLAFCLLTGLWDKTMITLYLCLSAAIVSVLMGLPLAFAGVCWLGFGRVLNVWIELLQTMPSFVYLIPVVMLFRVGDIAALIAIVAFAVTPVIRYTMAAFEAVPGHLIEAGHAMGCSPAQMLRYIRLPMALPAILLGISQCFLFSLAMVVITALVGTRDLGQEVYIALTNADTGRGIVAGLCLGLMGILIDRMFKVAAARLGRSEPGAET
ncbi:ABC transporter permease subunit [Mesorhizobium sp. M0204]|uniref:ABC transporter permease n=1 Tax=Mesorhizobium sp. M0204 TaxID=2956913 RepID=UPI003338E670